jgi:uncharacterized protein (DUF433 family)
VANAGLTELSANAAMALRSGAVARRAKTWNDQIDCSDCALVETKQGVQNGTPVLRGTRMPVSAIVDNFDYGVSVPEIAEQFELESDRIEAIVAYAQSHRVAHPVR